MQAEDKAVARARKRVEDVKGVYVHLLVYTLVNAGLFALDAVTGGGWWFYWPLVGWGIGLAIHMATVAFEGPFGPDWEDRKVRKLLAREREAM